MIILLVPEQEYLTQLIIQTAQRNIALIFQLPHITAERLSIYPAACLLSRLVQGHEIKRDLFSLPRSLPLTDGLGTLLRAVPPSPSFFKPGESLRPSDRRLEHSGASVLWAACYSAEKAPYASARRRRDACWLGEADNSRACI